MRFDIDIAQHLGQYMSVKDAYRYCQAHHEYSNAGRELMRRAFLNEFGYTPAAKSVGDIYQEHKIELLSSMMEGSAPFAASFHKGALTFEDVFTFHTDVDDPEPLYLFHSVPGLQTYYAQHLPSDVVHGIIESHLYGDSPSMADPSDMNEFIDAAVANDSSICDFLADENLPHPHDPWYHYYQRIANHPACLAITKADNPA